MVEEDGTLPPAEDIESSGQSYYGKKDESVSFKDIVIRAIEKVRIEGSKEMIKGGQRLVYSREIGDWVTATLPDQRKLYQQTVLQLYDLLIWYFDDEANKSLPKIKEEMNSAYKKYFDEYIRREHWHPYREAAAQSGIIKTGKDSDVGAFFLQQYEEYIQDCYRRMYQELILLFKRRNELSKKRTSTYHD